MGLEHYAAAQAAGAPAIHHIELAWKGFSYDYERLTLPLAEGSGLPPMVLTFITCSNPQIARILGALRGGMTLRCRGRSKIGPGGS